MIYNKKNLKYTSTNVTSTRICVPRPKNVASLSFLAEALPRLENRRGQKALFGRGAHKHF
jgi:hypothetical protein